jgi:hypothetical protein
MPAQRLAQSFSAEPRSSRLPLHAAPASARLDQASVRLATYLFQLWWWSLRRHVADRNLLPLDEAAGPPPRF